MKFRKKPIIIEATQWFKNGDHPKDDCFLVYPNTTREFLSEGKVVRHFRRPDVPGDRICELCGRTMDVHGWIDAPDTLEGGSTVCPGDWIITGIKRGYSPCKPDTFEAIYEKVEEE